jgi:hypothetical protein
MGRRGVSAVAALLLALTLAGCGDDDDDKGDSSKEPATSGLDADANALVGCLGDADVDASVSDSEAFGVDSEHVGVEAKDLPSDVLKYDTGSGTAQSLSLWIFGSADDAEDARAAITLTDVDNEKSWVDGRVVLNWDYPVNREADQAVAVDDCVAALNG